MIGRFDSFVYVIVAIIFDLKLTRWVEYALEIVPIIIGVFFVGA